MSAILIVRYTRINFTQCDVANCSSDFGILANKHGHVELAFMGDLLYLIQWLPSLSHFHQEIFHQLHFM